MNPGLFSCIESSGVTDMKNQKAILGTFAFIGLFILIIDSKTALTGAAEGFSLCIQTVIPSLFPFFILSAVINICFSGQAIPLLAPLGCFLGVPKGSESILIPAFFAGYPVGAQAVSLAFKRGQLNRHQAERLLAFCSNPGPSFLFGIIGSAFSHIRTVWVLWGIILLSAVLVARLLPPCAASDHTIRSENPSPTDPMQTAIRSTAVVCGWIILFRVLIAFADKWFLWLLPPAGQTLVIGSLELANGCCELGKISEEELRFLICGCMLSLGGFCVTMQTGSVIGALRPTYYYIGKLLQTLITFVLCISVVHRLWFVPVAAVCLMALVPRAKKSSSIPEKAIV